MKVMSREEKSSNDDLLSEPMERQDGFLGLQVVEGQMAGVSCGSLASPISMVSVSMLRIFSETNANPDVRVSLLLAALLTP